MRPVSTMSSVVSVDTTSRSGRWMVTGTTASSGDHSIITGCAGLSGRLGGELGEEFGMAGLGKAGAVEHVLGDRIGDHGGGAAGQHVGDRAADRGDRRRRAAGVGLAGRGGDREFERHHRQRAREGGGGFGGRDHGKRHVEPEDARAALKKIRVADQIKGRQVELDASPPDREREIGTDPRRLAEGQRQRKLPRALICLLCTRSSPVCGSRRGISWPRHRSAWRTAAGASRA